MVSSPYYDRYDNPYWEYHLPINPPIQPGKDIDQMTGGLYSYQGPDRCEIPLELNDEGVYTFTPRMIKNWTK